jgi:hypothetical protein
MRFDKHIFNRLHQVPQFTKNVGRKSFACLSPSQNQLISLHASLTFFKIMKLLTFDPITNLKKKVHEFRNASQNPLRIPINKSC